MARVKLDSLVNYNGRITTCGQLLDDGLAFVEKVDNFHSRTKGTVTKYFVTIAKNYPQVMTGWEIGQKAYESRASKGQDKIPVVNQLIPDDNLGVLGTIGNYLVIIHTGDINFKNKNYYADVVDNNGNLIFECDEYIESCLFDSPDSLLLMIEKEFNHALLDGSLYNSQVSWLVKENLLSYLLQLNKSSPATGGR